MATYKPTYASTSDLRDIYPNIDKYDAKTRILGWQLGLENLYDGLDIYYTANTGIANQLFWDGAKVDKITFNTTETTKVDGAFTPEAEVFYVDASHGLEANDIIKIDEEYIRIVSVSSDTITISSPSVNRGLFGSSAQHHANDTSVYKIIDASVDIGDATSASPSALSFVYDYNLDLALLITNSLNPIDNLVESGENWTDHINDIRYKASRYVDSWLDSSMPRTAWKNDEDQYDYVLVRTTAMVACYFLISAHDPENPDGLKLKEEFEAILDKINAGDIKLGFEISADSSQGIIRELVGLGSLKPVDLRGKYTGGVYDKIRIEIETEGVLATAKYGVWVKGNDRLGINKGNQIVTSETITGEYQSIGGGLQIRFGGSTATGTNAGTTDLMTSYAYLNDVWEIEVWGVGEELNDNRQMRSINAVRV